MRKREQDAIHNDVHTRTNVMQRGNAASAELTAVADETGIDSARFREMERRASDPATPKREQRRLSKAMARIYSAACIRTSEKNAASTNEEDRS